MDQKWFVSSIFGTFCLFTFSNFFHVTSHTLANSGRTNNDIDSDVWKSDGDHFPVLQENFSKDFRGANGNLNKQPSGIDVDENKRWLKILNFSKNCNLRETDKGPQNETKNIFINTEEHLQIFENDDEEGENENKINSQSQEGGEENVFHLLSPEGFLSQIITQDQSRALERIKRQAEDEDDSSGKRRCRCRRRRRRGRRRGRMRRRRNRTGQQRPAGRRRRRRGRRRNGRRGRRRCVCRKKGDGEEKSEDGDGEEPEVEEADEEEEGTTEDGGETTTEGDGEEGEEGNEEEGDDDDEDEDEDEEEEEESSSASEGEMPSLNSIPTYVFPYPNMIGTPIAVMPVG